MNLKVTYYSRVSTDHLEQKSSLKNQKEHFEKQIKETKTWQYVPGYIDEGITGTSATKRDNFMKMIEDAQKGMFDLIITKEISRFSRNTLDSIKYTRELLSYGVAVLFVNDNINTALPDSELRLTIMASLAQDEIRRLSERVKFGMREAIRRGTILGNNQLYGYEKDPNTNKLVINKNEAVVIKRIFTLYALNKLSLTKIAKLLNQEKVFTRTNKLWTASTLSRMIKNIKYKGYYCGRKTEIVDYMTKKVKYFPEKDWLIYKDSEKIPPLISEHLWKKANERLKATHTSKKRGSTTYPYSSKLICKNDESYFYCRGKNIKIWHCSKYLTEGRKKCPSPSISDVELTSILKEVFSALDLTPCEKLLKKIYKELKISSEINDVILKILSTDNTYLKLVCLLLEKIVVGGTKQSITLEIYLKVKLPLSQSTYTFKRHNKIITYSISLI